MRRTTTLILAAVLCAPSALADKKVDKKACSDSYEKAQVLQKDSKLNDARVQLLVCSQDSCPKWIQTECVKWLADVDEHQPSIVIAAQDAQGKDVFDASVEIDGTMVSSKVEGAAVRVDPGPHTVRLVHDGQTTEQQIVARIGEKNRKVEILIKGGGASEPPPVEHTAKKASPVPAIVVGSLGLAALGTSIAIGLVAKSDVDSMRSTCAPHCMQSDIDAANTKLLISDVLTGVGIAGIAAGVLLFIFRPTVKENAGFLLQPARGGASLGLRF
jgi:hypothetical protein